MPRIVAAYGLPKRRRSEVVEPAHGVALGARREDTLRGGNLEVSLFAPDLTLRELTPSALQLCGAKEEAAAMAKLGPITSPAALEKAPICSGASRGKTRKDASVSRLLRTSPTACSAPPSRRSATCPWRRPPPGLRFPGAPEPCSYQLGPLFMMTLILMLVQSVPAASTTSTIVVASASPYRTRLAVDLPMIGLGLAGASIAFVPVPAASCLPSCVVPAGLSSIDRSVIGNYSEGTHTVADIGVLTLVLAPLALDLLDSRGDGFFEDATVYVEALALAQAATQLTKIAVRRNAPFVYDPNVPLDVKSTTDANRSFFSGHTAMAFTAATAYSVTFWLRHPDSPWRWVVLAVSEAMAATIGLLKIGAGYHYYTDVGVGALVGISIGTLVPLLHAL